MKVKDVMHHSVVTAPDGGTLDQVARLMWEFDCGVIPVASDDGRLAGIVTDRDICMAAYTQGRPLHEIPVGTAMAWQVVAVHAGDTVEAAEGLMRANQIRRLPVLDGDGRPIGLVSLNDLARVAARTRRSTVDRELVDTLAGISEPHTGGDMNTARHALLA